MNSTDPSEMTTYSCKILAENTQLLGYLEQALVFALSYRTRQQDCKRTYSTDKNLQKRIITTTIQETYIIVHELIHAILDQDHDWRSAAIRDARGDYFVNRLLTIAEATLVEENSDTLYKESLMTQIDMFLSNDSLVEECVCDTLALPIIWHIFDSYCDIPTIRSAIFFALRHLRILKVINSYSDAITSDAINTAYVNTYMIRMGFLQWTLQQFEPFRKLVSSDINDTTFMAEQERYEHFVADPVYEDVYQRVQYLKTNKFSTPNYSSINQLNANIDDLIGNADVIPRIKKLGEDFFLTDLKNFDQDYWMERKRKFDSD